MTLELEALSVRHGRTVLLRDVSLLVGAGDSLCLVGASGGGKSLVAQAVAGLLPDCMAASGLIRIGRDRRLASDGAGLRALWGRSCVLPQEPGRALVPHLSARRQLELAPPPLSPADAERWLARFGLGTAAGRQRPGALSGGMAQRLLVALLARSPATALVLDEPTTGLDAPSRAGLLQALRALRDGGRALLVITHDLQVVRALDGGLAVLQDGAIAERGGSRDLLRRPGSGFLRACLAADPAGWPARRSASAGPDVAEAENMVIGHRTGLAGPLRLGLGAGQLTAVLGPSGCGKTTLGDTMLGLLPPRDGRLLWFGRTLTPGRVRRLRPRFQKLHQDPTSVFPRGRRLRDSLDDLRRLPGGADAVRRLPDLLERLRLRPELLERRPDQVSGGEAQRMALARVLALRPALLVADEPASRLDPPVQADALLLLRELVDADGMAAMLITHDPAAAAALADASLVLAPAGSEGQPMKASTSWLKRCASVITSAWGAPS